MKALLHHHAKRFSVPGAQVNGIRNCHVIGLHSIMLHDEPGNRIRMFYTSKDHVLYRNRIGSSFSLGIHGHHCDVLLCHLIGDVRNHLHALVPNYRGAFEKKRYTSAIKGGKPGLEPGNEHFDAPLLSAKGLENNHVYMYAHELHTIYVPQYEEAAWLVFEGAEDDRYESVCYTNNDVFNAENLYQKMSAQEALQIVAKVLKEMP